MSHYARLSMYKSKNKKYKPMATQYKGYTINGWFKWEQTEFRTAPKLVRGYEAIAYGNPSFWATNMRELKKQINQYLRK